MDNGAVQTEGLEVCSAEDEKNFNRTCWALKTEGKD